MDSFKCDCISSDEEPGHILDIRIQIMQRFENRRNILAIRKFIDKYELCLALPDKSVYPH
jgi:hypothetical protein